MPFLGNIFFQRADAPKDVQNIQIGSLFYNEDQGTASILLTSWYAGQWACVPYPKYKQFCEELDLAGDIMVPSGEFSRDGLNNKLYAWCGFCQSANDERGTMYWGTLECLPISAFVAAAKEAALREINGSDLGKKSGLWLSIFRASDAKRNYVRPGLADVFDDPPEAKLVHEEDLPW